MDAAESVPKSTRASDVAVALTPVPGVEYCKKITSTRRALKIKPDRRFEARQVVLGRRQKHHIGCGTTSVCRFDLLVIASAKKINIPDVQTVVLIWFLDKNELKTTIHFSKLYRVKEHSCS